MKSLVARACMSFGVVALVAGGLAAPSADAARRAVKMHRAYEFWPGTVYDTELTRSYPNAHGTVTTPAGKGNNPPCRIQATGLRPTTEYTVFVDLDGSTQGDVSTAGPWEFLGGFTTNRGGNGSFVCEQTPPNGSSLQVNQADVNRTILQSDNVTTSG